jgi:hypothetical protein
MVYHLEYRCLFLVDEDTKRRLEHELSCLRRRDPEGAHDRLCGYSFTSLSTQLNDPSTLFQFKSLSGKFTLGKLQHRVSHIQILLLRTDYVQTPKPGQLVKRKSCL